MGANRNYLLLAVLGVAAEACADRSPEVPTGIESARGASRPALSPHGPGAVYVMSNAPSGNAILVFSRAPDGQLTPAGSVATGGTGTGGGLENQEAMVLTHHRLYVVNAGSNSVSTLAVTPAGLQPIGAPLGSGGQEPISLTVHRELLYVLNAGGTGNITGFRIGRSGELTAIPGSSRPVSSPAASAFAAQIKFSPDGRVLVVTERATHSITTYTMARDGTPSDPIPHLAAGKGPFGFGFTHRGDLIVSEAGGGPGGSTVSSYRLDQDGGLELITGPVATTQTAACWVAISRDGKLAFTTNTASNTISSLAIGHGGTLELEEAVAAATGPGSFPQDVAFSTSGRFLYVRNAGGTIAAFRLEGNGTLTHLADYGPLPPGANGLLAR